MFENQYGVGIGGRLVRLFHGLTFDYFRCVHTEMVVVASRHEEPLRCVRLNNHRCNHELPVVYGFNGGGWGTY